MLEDYSWCTQSCGPTLPFFISRHDFVTRHNIHVYSWINILLDSNFVRHCSNQFFARHNTFTNGFVGMTHYFLFRLFGLSITNCLYFSSTLSIFTNFNESLAHSPAFFPLITFKIQYSSILLRFCVNS